MPNSETTILIVVTPELRQAAQEYAEANERTLSDVAREALARKIGRPGLAAATKRGRPRKVED